MDHFTVEEQVCGQFVIVPLGHEPLPAIFDDRAKAQRVAERLNIRLSTAVGSGDGVTESRRRAFQEAMRDWYDAVTRVGTMDGPNRQ